MKLNSERNKLFVNVNTVGMIAQCQGMIAEMAERAATKSEVPSLSPSSGSYENQKIKLKPFCQLQHAVINIHEDISYTCIS